MLSFEECAAKYASNTTLQERWKWEGELLGIPVNNVTNSSRNATSQITRAGCLAVCGTGTDYYPWQDVSNTITTWILPVVGTLLQAPFESNATRRTLLAITRWVGSPIASLSYVLWNIKVSAKAALMVDMAVKYDDDTSDSRGDFASMRDSMYLLLVMNQYTVRSANHQVAKEAEGLLRIVLFSKDLVLTDTDKSLWEMRRILAREVREMRRRGAVPAFVSTLWFLFAFALSIQDAFGDLGGNATAHDLALGCLLAWFPILIMGSIVDRNPIAAEPIRKKLNALVDHVRHALSDPQHCEHFINTFREEPRFPMLRTKVQNVVRNSKYMKNFFSDFAGQARVRWHYGAAHPILSDIEDCYIAKKGRNWLKNEDEARASLVLGPVNEGLVWFDIREFWQIASAIIIVGGSCGGAFILSFFTPTVGLGCRSGGYTIFFCIALGLLVFEMTIWLLLSPNQALTSDHGMWRSLRRTASDLGDRGAELLIGCAVWVALLFPWKDTLAVKGYVKDTAQDIREWSPERKWEVLFFRPVETFNTIWLVYIVFAQVFGGYRTCECVTSGWAGGGGYLDFNVQDTSNSHWVLWYWTTGTLLTGLVLAFSMFYITVEWCQQSFLSTEDYDAAMQGLRMTRKFRHWTFIFRRISRVLSKITLDPLEKLLLKEPQNTLLWAKGYTWDPQVNPVHSQAVRPEMSSIAAQDLSPSIQVSDYDTIAPHGATQGTPAMALSPFSPASPPFRPRPRTESDVTLSAVLGHRISRPSNESSQPLMQRSSEDRSSGEGRASSDGRPSFEAAISPVALQGQSNWSVESASLSGQEISASLHSRQRYQRADSDSGKVPDDVVAAAQGDLGIRYSVRGEDLEMGDYR
ncbi:hypothetical protein M011DRAFT_43793 [Sporormia fimetaria CBS 119925]|uniref:Uncharacterized protein n=1 Tax=Sporormia fimetaria CBS 119925 TaxID=1340428 RepID=A0A6A6VCW5_9PLEO|nr:hypothetical protein M011DRAFT_43793 [Sporormia fimetaria CBS 119925]